MTRTEWTGIAKAIGELRSAIHDSRPTYSNGDHALTYWAAQLTMIDMISRRLAKQLKRGSQRFDEDRFLELCGVRPG